MSEFPSETSAVGGMPEFQPQAPPPPTSTLAIVSLVASILGLTLVPFLGSIVGVVTGHMALKEIREKAGQVGGETLAKVGLGLGYGGLVLILLCLCAFTLFLVLSALSYSNMMLLLM